MNVFLYFVCGIVIGAIVTYLHPMLSNNEFLHSSKTRNYDSYDDYTVNWLGCRISGVLAWPLTLVVLLYIGINRLGLRARQRRLLREAERKQHEAEVAKAPQSLGVDP